MSSGGAAHERAWTLLLAAAARRRGGTLPSGPVAFRAGDDGALEGAASDDPGASLLRGADGRFAAGPALDEDEREFVELYLPLLGGRDDESTVLAHLGQSVDGYIATASGHSAGLTGRADFVHMHRLRALADAVLVGAGTVAADDPRLTTRLVDGPSPVRVVVDPRGRLGDDHGVFTDGAASTLRVVRRDDKGDKGDKGDEDDEGGVAPPDDAGTLVVDDAADGGGTGLSLPELLRALRARGIRVVFVEGGGITVTRWLTAGLLDRLHVTVAPVLVGEGRPALRLPPLATMSESLRPRCRCYRLGRDVLWDFDLRGTADEASALDDTFRRLS